MTPREPDTAPRPNDKSAGTGTGAKRGRKSRFAGRKIVLIKRDNPRRPGTHGWRSYEILRDAGRRNLTYEQYIEAGGRSNDLAWDLDKGHVEVK